MLDVTRIVCVFVYSPHACTYPTHLFQPSQFLFVNSSCSFELRFFTARMVVSRTYCNRYQCFSVYMRVRVEFRNWFTSR